jgi:membrane protein DedA with SNARE-associated domain
MSTQAITNLLSTWGYLAVFLFILIESSGIPFPGETMLLTAAAYAGAGHLQIPFVILAAASGAILGDNLGFFVGRTGGRNLALRFGRYVRLDAGKLQTAERFYQRHGDKTVFLGRYVAILRAWSAFLAGLNRMPWPKFVLIDSVSALTWSLLWGILAFELGRNLSLLHKVVTGVGLVGIAVVLLLVAVLYVLHRRGRRVEAELEDVLLTDEPRSESTSPR